MAGYVTQSRKTGAVLPWEFKYSDISGNTIRSEGKLTQLNDENQVTTSFRTGSSYVYSEPKTAAQFFRAFIDNSSFDTGHNFSTLKNTALYSHKETSLQNGNIAYKGPLLMDQSVLPVAERYKPWIVPSAFDSTYYGTAAIAATMPTQSIANLSQSLTEIYREGLPALVGASTIKTRVLSFKNLGGEYLNIQFGWAPFVSDFVALLNAVVDAQKHIHQYQRDSGRLVRRSFTFPRQPPTTTNSEGTAYLRNIPNSSRFGALFKGGLAGPFPFSNDYTMTTKYSFSGAYTYYLPSGDNFGDKVALYAAKAQHLLGIRLTPDVLWNLAPWTWLSDWVFNIGDNISVATAMSQDGLLLKYGYVMREQNSQRALTIKNVRDHTDKSVGVIRELYSTSQKLRVRADPYGFAVKPGDYTTRQWAILAALGMSRGQGNLARFGD